MSAETLILLALGIPLLTGAAIILFAKVSDLRETATMAGAISLFGVVVMLVARVAGGEVPELAGFTAIPVPDALSAGGKYTSLDFAFKLEPLGALFAAIASGLWIVNSLYSFGYMRGNRERNQTRFYVCFAIAIFGAIGVAMAGNLFTLFVFYEVLTISTYPLVAHKGDDNARRGARIYLMTLLGTSIGFFLVALTWTYAIAGSLDFQAGGLLSGQISGAVASALLILFAFGIGKAALMPFHFWLPNAMVAPTPVSALLHAVAVVKAGVFTILKVSIYIFGADTLANDVPSRDLILIVACATILISSLIALTKDNLKARLAYSTVGQLSYCTVGAMLVTEAALSGASLQIAAHAFGKITLFMCAGAIYVATGLTNISDMRGLGRRMPIVFIAFLVGSLSIIGLPPMAGVWAKYGLMQGAVDAGYVWVVWVLIGSTLLNVAYLLPIAFLGLMPPKGTAEPAPYKRPGGAPFLTVLAPAVTAVGTVVVFFAGGQIANFLAPALTGGG